MGGEPGEIPTAGVRPSNDDEGNTLARSQRQRGHRPKKAVLIECIDRAHEPEDSTSRLGSVRQSGEAWPPFGGAGGSTPF